LSTSCDIKWGEYVFDIYYIKGTVTHSLLKNLAYPDYSATVTAQVFVTNWEWEQVHMQLGDDWIKPSSVWFLQVQSPPNGDE